MGRLRAVRLLRIRAGPLRLRLRLRRSVRILRLLGPGGGGMDTSTVLLAQTAGGAGRTRLHTAMQN